MKELQLPSIASLRAVAALKSPHLAVVRPARIGLGFESASSNQRTLAEVEALLGGPGRLSLPYALRWLLDVLTGLGVLHRTLGFVHGEVAPDSIVLGDDGVGRLIPVVRAHWVRGERRAPERLYYLAPEKLLGDNVDVRADVFSVGVMLWEALSGQRLLEAYTVDDIISRLMGGGIPRARAPEGEAWTTPLTEIAQCAIAVDPGRRFGSVAEMKASIEAASQRYLASAPGMAELFQNPERRARNHLRDSIAPESQRVTLPPTHSMPPDPVSSLSPGQVALEAAAERLSRSSFLPPEPEEVTTLSRKPVPAREPVDELLPVVRRGRHIDTLLGVPLPAVERHEPSAPESVTTPFARPLPTTAPPIVIPTVSPSASDAPPAPLPFGKTRLQFGPAEATHPEHRMGPAPAALPAPQLALAPAPALRAPATAPVPIVAEPSFELVRPRKRHGAVWVVLGAAVAIALFAARPWLAQQVAAATGSGEQNARQSSEATQNAAALATANTASPHAAAVTAASASAIGIASTPPTPSHQGAPPKSRGVAREEHVVIHDRLEQNVSPAAPVVPPDPPEPPKHEPAVEPPSSPPPSPPPPKPKPVPVSDADRYGI